MNAVFHDRLQGELEERYAYGASSRTRFLHRLRIETMRRLFDRYKVGGLNALDLGCGHGVYSILLGERGNCVLACDPDGKAIVSLSAWARIRGLARNEQLLGVAERIPTSDANFDVIVCSDVLEHTQDIGTSVAELGRVLKNGGLAFVSMPNKHGFGYFPMIIRYFIRHRRRNPDPHTHFTPARIRGLFRRFAIEEEAGSGILPLPGRLLALVTSKTWLARGYLSLDRLLAKTFLRALASNYFVVLRKPATDARDEPAAVAAAAGRARA